MSRLPTLTIVTLAALGAAALAGSAAAQVPGQASGLRYLSWNARPAVARTTEAAAQPAAEPVSQPVASTAPGIVARRPNRVIPHGGMAAAVAPRPGLTPAPGAVPGRLTPANAWLRPAPIAEAPAAEPLPAPPVAMAGPPVYAPPPASAPPPPPPPPRDLPAYMPDRSGQPAPAAMVEPQRPELQSPDPTALATPGPEFDPMAPRRDAPIFRMRQEATPVAQETTEAAAPARAAPSREASSRDARDEPTRLATVAHNTADRPPQQGARYYSVHRQNGQQPDAMVMPESTYVDALTLTMTETPASQDLAQPDQAPTLIRDNQGRVRPAPAASDGDHQ